MEPSKSRLVASITAETTSELLKRAVEFAPRVDAVELRVDGVRDPDLARLHAGRPGTTILTCRSKAQGGAFRGSEEDRLKLLEQAVALGFDYVDLEIESAPRSFPKSPSKIIRSHHDFDGLPADASAIVDRALGLGADVVKLAARVGSLDDTMRLAKLGERVRAAGREFAPVPLGPSGTSGRILASRLGAFFAYAPVSATQPTGPGQVPLDELEGLYRFRQIGEATKIYGIVGTRVLESRSPAMHNRFFAKIGRDAVYVPFQESRITPFLEAARALPVSGLSITIPFKEEIIPFLDDLDPVVSRIGAVNTVVVRDGRWIGFNTDYLGVSEPLERFGPWENRRAIIVGAGGAARAAAFALREKKASLLVLSRREARAAALAERFGAESGSLERLGASRCDLLVNATPADIEYEPAPGSVVFDMVTLPEETDLVRRSRQKSARTITGLEMLAAQARHQALLWTGESPSYEQMLSWARGKRLDRYSRQVLFKEIGAGGQGRIGEASVLVVGAGALGSVASEMLVRAGVGRMRLVDRDYVDETNLQRQSLYDETDVREGLPKAVAAARKLTRINGDVTIDFRVEDVHPGNIVSLLDGVDLVMDGTDNFETRYLMNDACIREGVPWIYAACVGSYGMSYVIWPGRGPCLRCFLEHVPAPGTSPTCDTSGVIAPAVHAVASFQVSEALKILSGREDALTGALYSIDVWSGRVDSFKPAERRPDCPACGAKSFPFLDGVMTSETVTLCGRNAVQVRPAAKREVPLEAVARQLEKLGEVTANRYLLRAKLDGLELVLFEDGRAIVHGTEDPAEAKSLYARYVGA
ncbi:MAG TPA: type I 3-dehydroquinate dehydratase [Vicinamibacteria bacterium]|nr:type I 3-dehydroquinate dehydratase [Vicinamibacteria bacterium]